MKRNLFILIFLILILSSCVSNTHKVTFINDGELYETQNVQAGGVVRRPETPFKDATNEIEYKFIGWFNGDMEWDFKTKVTEDIKLTAKYSKQTRYYRVLFKDVDGTILKEDSLEYNETITPPAAPTKATDGMYNYEFDGWENENGNLYTIVPNVTCDVVYMAHYKVEGVSYTLSYYDEYDELIYSQKVPYGSYVNLKSIPEKEGYVGSWNGEKHDVMPAHDVSYKLGYELEKYKAVIKCDNKDIVIEYTILDRNQKLKEINDLVKNKDDRYDFYWRESLPDELPLYNTSFVIDKKFKETIETFNNISVVEENKQLKGKYSYYSNSGSTFPISINKERLEFKITRNDTYAVLSIDLGKVSAGNTYSINFDLEMFDSNNNYLTDGFAYALASTKGVSTGSVGSYGILQAYKLLNKNGTFSISYVATETVDNLYLLIRSQKTNGFALYIDNLQIYEVVEEPSEFLYGVGEPLNFSNVKDFDRKKTVELISMLNAKSYRMWFGVEIFEGWVWNKPLDDFIISSDTKRRYEEIFADLSNAGVEEVTVMGHYLPVTTSTVSSSGNEYYVPHIGTSDYQVFLDKIYELWYELALAFPQVKVWEVGNETNNAHYLRYVDFEYMSYSDMAKINTDMLYYAYQGIKKANPNAMVITPGFAPVTSYYNANTNTENYNITKLNNGIDSIEIFLKYIYQNISSGSFPYHNNSSYVNKYDKNPDMYFDGLAWHPYDLGKVGYANTNDPDLDSFNVDLWVNANNRCYQVMKDNGDGDKEVWFTEFGLTTKSSNLIYSLKSSGSPYEYYIYYEGGKVDFNDGKTTTYKQIDPGYYYIYYKDYETYAKNQESFIRAYFKAMSSKNMNYVHACHFFRMFSSSLDYSWNGLTVLYYGIFTEAEKYLARGYYPTKKAYVIQDIYGGIGNLMKYSTYESVHPGDVVIYDGVTESFTNGILTGLSGNSCKYKGNFYAYSSNNNGTYTLDNGILTMKSTSDSYLAFKLNGFKKGVSYTVSFSIPNCESNSAFIIYTSNVCDGKWDNTTRLQLFGGTNTAVLLSKLSKTDNTYSYTFTLDKDFDSLYFTFRNNGNFAIEEIKVNIN